MTKIITNKKDFYFDYLPPKLMDVQYLEYLILKEASGDKVSWEGISREDVNDMVRKLQDKNYLRGSSINGEPVWSQLRPKGRDRLKFLEKEYTPE